MGSYCSVIKLRQDNCFVIDTASRIDVISDSNIDSICFYYPCIYDAAQIIASHML